MARSDFSRVTFRPDGLLFPHYPFRGASVREAPFVPISAIAEILPTRHPPAVVTQAGEFLFVSAEDHDALVEWAETHGVPLRNREDAWSLLLEPFLDTEYTDAQAERDLERLRGLGLSPEETVRWRKRVSGRMNALTFASWEWVDYNLYDLLFATRAFHAWDGWLKPAPFYREVMAVARLGGSWPVSPHELRPPTPLAGENEPAGGLEVECRDPARAVGRVFVTLSTGGLEDPTDGCSVQEAGDHGKVRWSRLKPGRYRVFAADLDFSGKHYRYWHGEIEVAPDRLSVLTLAQPD